jgi:hypothetical protein
MTHRQTLALALVADYALWFALGFLLGYFIL